MRRTLLFFAVVPALLIGPAALAQKKGNKAATDEPQRVAIAYLKALEGSGDDLAKDYLLGGATLTAEDFTIPNWKIKTREPAKVETGSVKAAMQEMRALEKAGREALNAVVNMGDEENIASLDQAAAEKMMAPTRARAKAFQKKYPLFAYTARVGKDVFWHPSNPFRAVLEQMGKTGKYRLELHKFMVEETEPGNKPRVWPLRVLRIQTKSYDSGWKILPASDWDPEY